MSEQSDDVVAKADSMFAECESIEKRDYLSADFHLAAAARTLIPELRDEVLRLRDLSDHNFEAAAQLQTEIERLHTWDGLMSVLNEHYWESVFPTLPDDPDVILGRASCRLFGRLTGCAPRLSG